MSANFNNNFKSLIDDLMEQRLIELKQNNHSYHMLKERETNLFELIEEVADELPNDDREIFMQYVIAAETVNYEAQTYLYQQGIKDGIKLLKSLEVI